MRRAFFAAVILLVPAVASLLLFLIINPTRLNPTSRDAVGLVTTLAGSVPVAKDGAALSAGFSDPFGIAIDKKGNLIITDGGQSNRIRAITKTGEVTTIAGGDEGFADGKVSNAAFNTPSGLAIDKSGNIIIADTSNNRIRRVDVKGFVTTVAGTGESGFNDGPATEARFDGPIGVAVDDRGYIFVCDTYNDIIRRISPDGTVDTIAGGGSPGFSDGDARSARFDTPTGVAVDKQGVLFIADAGNDAIRRISASGEVTTFAGGLRGREDGRGTDARFAQPTGIAITNDGFLFVTDSASGLIRRISPEGDVTRFAGGRGGYSDGEGGQARFNGPTGIAVDRDGNAYVADSQNYLIRRVSPTSRPAVSDQYKPELDELQTELKTKPLFIQPAFEPVISNADSVVPRLSASILEPNSAFRWPLNPTDAWHEVAGVMGEARGAAGGIALDHLHAGLDIRGNMGDPALSIVDEKVANALPNWDFEGLGEGMQVGLMSYIHVRVGRDKNGQIREPDRFKARAGESGELVGVRIRRGTRFKPGDFIGTLNRLYHVHLNFGPWHGQANPIQLPFPGFRDTIPPIVEASGITVVSASGSPLTQLRNGRLVVSGDVDIIVTAWDKVDGNNERRRLGLYKLGYQVVKEDGSSAEGFEEPVMNIEFNRLPPDDEAVFIAYAEGSGVSAYGGETRFRYVVTNRIRDGQAIDGILRTSSLREGNYKVRIIAEDYAGNRATGKTTELGIEIVGQ